MSQVELQHGAATDVGRVREVNEDAFLVAPPVFVVADGMGGHDGGDVASADRGRGVRAARARRATTRAAAPTPSPPRCADCQARIAAYAAEQRAAGAETLPRRHHRGGRPAGRGRRRPALAADEPRRLPRSTGTPAASLEQVSVDHSLVQEMVDAGTITAAQAEVHPERHVVTRALGGRNAAADYFLVPVAAAPRLLLCSDGVTGMIDDARIAEVLGRVAEPAGGRRGLVAAARGGRRARQRHGRRRRRAPARARAGPPRRRRAPGMSDGPRTHRSYRPGDWFGIFGDRTTVLLPPGEKARVPALWQLLDDGAGFDEALDALVAGGLRGLPGFVLLSEERRRRPGSWCAVRPGPG